MASYISQVVIGNNTYPLGSLLYGTCNTAANTADKVVTLAAFDTLATGITVYVSFDNANTAANPTLKVGSTAVKSIISPNGSLTWAAQSIIGFTYNGTNWVMQNADVDFDSVALTGTPTAPTAPAGTNTTQIATTEFVTNAVSGLTGAMHFVGISSTAITNGGTEKPTINSSVVNTLTAGDVVLYNNGEYVWDGSAWKLLGDEGSYALKTNTESVVKSITFTKNTLPSLTVTNVSIPNVTSAGTAPTLTKTDVSIPNVTTAGTASTFNVASGTLTITPGSNTVLGTAISATHVDSWAAGSAPTLGTAISVGSASGWNAGAQASLTSENATVVKP